MDNSHHSSNMSESHSDQGAGSVENEREGEMEKEDEKTDYMAKLRESLDEARRHLVENNPMLAHDIVFDSLKKAVEKQGGDNELDEFNIAFLPAYYLLGECCIKMGKQKKAQDFLIAAYWNSLKSNKEKGDKKDDAQTADALEEFQALRHKAFAKLFEAQKDYNKAIDELSNAIYLDSTKQGPDSPMLSASYFDLGRLFLIKKEKNSQHETSRFYEKIINIWYNSMKRLVRNLLTDREKMALGPITRREAINLLRGVKDYYQNEDLGTGAEMRKKILMKIFFSLSLLHQSFSELAPSNVNSRYCLEMAQELYGAEGDKYIKIQGLLPTLD